MRTFKLRPVLAGSALTFFVLLLVAYVGATAYLVYRDDLLGAAVSRQVRMQYAYEERIAALRSELDRLTSRHVVQTEGVEQQLSTLLEQQALIESRQSALDDLVETARAAGLDLTNGAPRVPQARPQEEAPGEDAAQDSVGPLSYLSPDAESGGPIADLLIQAEPDGPSPARIRPVLSSVGAALDDFEAAQSQTLDALSLAAEGEIERISAVLMPLGLEVDATLDGGSDAQGGPFIPTAGLHFVERTAILKRTLDDLQSLRHAATVMPLSVPIATNRISSRFGTRLDPFLKRPAFHAGLDFVAAAGTIVHATAPGRVVLAGWNGGYGKMVEIEHADGISTRYGHLSATLVSVGDVVSTGSPIGRVGSTGRSTGPHLHYETRRDGEAVNPATYLAAGKALRVGL